MEYEVCRIHYMELKDSPSYVLHTSKMIRIHYMELKGGSVEAFDTHREFIRNPLHGVESNVALIFITMPLTSKMNPLHGVERSHLPTLPTSN